MKIEEIFCNLFGFSKNTYYLWKREKKPIIKLIDKYFDKYELEEFLKNGKINKLEIINQLNLDRNVSSMLTIDALYDIEYDGAFKGKRHAFADFLAYSSKKNDDFEKIKYSYLTEKTNIDVDYKIEFIKNNNIDINLLFPFLIDGKNDLIQLIEFLKIKSKYYIVEAISEFVVPFLDIKYNNTCEIDNYEYLFTEHICKMYNLENTDRKGFIDEGRKDIDKNMIVSAIESFLYQIKNKGKK